MTRISIAMATYNGARYIQEQLESLARQTVLPCELVVTDDGSNDSTLSIVKRFAETAPFPVCIYRNEKRLNFADNFLHAASLCKGDWIAFCDQDDVWFDNKLAVISERISRHHEAVLLVHSALMTDESLVPTSISIPNFRHNGPLPPLCETGFAREKNYSGFAMVFRHDLLSLRNAVRYPSTPYCTWNDYSHDRYIHMLATIFGEIVFIRDHLAFYRRHGENLSSLGLGDTTISKLLSLKRARTVRKEETFNFAMRFEEIADILAQATIDDHVLKTRADRASAMYRERAKLFARRGKLYSESRIERLAGFAGLLKIFAYRAGSLGVSGLVSDIMTVVL